MKDYLYKKKIIFSTLDLGLDNINEMGSVKGYLGCFDPMVSVKHRQFSLYIAFQRKFPVIVTEVKSF